MDCFLPRKSAQGAAMRAPADPPAATIEEKSLINNIEVNAAKLRAELTHGCYIPLTSIFVFLTQHV